MSQLLLIIHIVTAILFIGPVMVTVSAFGKHALAGIEGNERSDAIATSMHGITKVYGWLSALVPVSGLILMLSAWDVFRTHGNLHAAVLLSLIAWIILLAVIIPRQKKMVAAQSAVNDTAVPVNTDTAHWEKEKSRLAMFGGIFNLLWVICLVLMFLN